MEARLVEMEDMIKKLTTKVRSLQQENEVLLRANGKFMEDVGPSQNEHAESQNAVRVDAVEEERRQMHHELRELVDKYAKMTKKMDTSSSLNQLLTSTDLPYNVEVIVALLPLKFKVPRAFGNF